MKRLLILFTPLFISFVAVSQCNEFYYSQNISNAQDSASVKLGDLDGDGDLDAYITSSENWVSDKVWLNDGNGSFSNSGQDLGFRYSSDVSLGDLDGDGDLDAFVGNRWTQGNKVWFNDGTGFFVQDTNSYNDSYTSVVELGDLDGDGDLDAFIGRGYNTYNSPNQVYLNDGNGVFFNSAQNLGNSKTLDLKLADLDGDGDLDAFSTNYFQNNKVWLNDGNGYFTDSGPGYGSSISNGISLGDVDGDGDIDAFVSIKSTISNVIWLNDGNANFSNSGQSLGSSYSTDVALNDFDGDGDLDAFVANNGSNKLWINDGVGIFSNSGLSLGNSYSIRLDFGDLDNDSDVDVIVNNRSSNSKVWINNSIIENSIYVTSCSSYLWNGQIYSSSGIYYSTLLSSNGCDSIVELNLTIESNVTNLNASIITTNSAVLNWNSSFNMWNIEWGPAGFIIGSGTQINGVTSNPYTLSNLSDNTNYEFYVQTDCNPYGLGSWSGPFSFTTNSYQVVQISDTICDSYVSINGNIYTSTGIYSDTVSYSSQTSFLVNSPQNISGSFQYYLADLAGGWSLAPDMTDPLNSVTDTLILVDDGSAGLNAYGNPISAEGCNPIINDLTGKIAICYRGSCQFADKALNAQNAGAEAVILINNGPSVVGMSPGTNGHLISIPFINIDSTIGGNIVSEMNNGPVVVSIGSLSSDTIYNYDLTILNSSSNIINDTICGGETYTLNGQTYNSSGSYLQTITNTQGCDSTIHLNLTVNNNQFPLTFLANPTAGTTPLNVIFDNQTSNMSNYNFTWSFGDGNIVQDNGSFVSHTYQSDGTWDVTLIAEDVATGCTDTLIKNDYVFSTGGTPCGHSAIINQSGPITACLSDSVFLNCNTDPNFTYQWQLNGFPISGATNSIYYPIQSGSYTVIITDNNCPVFSSTIQVTINSFAAPIISASGTINSCTGGSVTLSVPDDYVSYLWSSGGTDSSEVVTSSGDYTVTVTNIQGCQATSTIYSINASFIPTQEICLITVDSTSSHNLIVWEKPVLLGIDSFIVYREMGTNNYMPIGSVAYDSLSQFIDTTTGINPNVTSYRYKLSLLDTCGTESNLSYYHETMHLSVNQGVGGEVNLIWDEYEGFPILYYYILRDSTLNGNWEVLDSVSSNNFIYTDLNPPLIGANYLIEVLPPYTCTSTKAIDHNSARSNRESGGVSNGGAPSSNFSTSITQITTGTSINFFDQSINNPTTWNWDFYGANPSTSTLQNPINITYNNIGFYDVRLIVSNANGIDTLVKTNYIEVISSGGAAPISEFIASSTQIQEGNTVDFLDQSQNNPTSWTWLFDGGNPAFSTNQSPSGVVYNTAGTYDVTLITSNSFGVDTLVKTNYLTVSNSIGLQENKNQLINVYPNPTNSNITLEFKKIELPCSISLKDIRGRLVYSTQATSEKLVLYLSNFEKGIYLIGITNDNLTRELKVVKQ